MVHGRHQTEAEQRPGPKPEPAMVGQRIPGAFGRLALDDGALMMPGQSPELSPNIADNCKEYHSDDCPAENRADVAKDRSDIVDGVTIQQVRLFTKLIVTLPVGSRLRLNLAKRRTIEGEVRRHRLKQIAREEGLPNDRADAQARRELSPPLRLPKKIDNAKAPRPTGNDNNSQHQQNRRQHQRDAKAGDEDAEEVFVKKGLQCRDDLLEHGPAPEHGRIPRHSIIESQGDRRKPSIVVDRSRSLSCFGLG